jgi:hypothetical protein
MEKDASCSNQYLPCKGNRYNHFLDFNGWDLSSLTDSVTFKVLSKSVSVLHARTVFSTTLELQARILNFVCLFLCPHIHLLLCFSAERPNQLWQAGGAQLPLLGPPPITKGVVEHL